MKLTSPCLFFFFFLTILWRSIQANNAWSYLSPLQYSITGWNVVHSLHSGFTVTQNHIVSPESKQTDDAATWPAASERASFQSKRRLSSYVVQIGGLTAHLGSDCAETQRHSSTADLTTSNFQSLIRNTKTYCVLRKNSESSTNENI